MQLELDPDGLPGEHELSEEELDGVDGGLKKASLDSMSDMGETESMRLQMYMDKKSKLQQTLSNLEQKTSQTSSAIIQNIK